MGPFVWGTSGRKRYYCAPTIVHHEPHNTLSDVPQKFPKRTFSNSEVKELRKLREQDPWNNTLTALSQRFQTSKKHVSLLAPSPISYRKERIKQQILKMNPSKAWKGRRHYKRIKILQKHLTDVDEKNHSLVGVILSDD
jgi:thioredoxin-like negative regulator of GroEL